MSPEESSDADAASKPMTADESLSALEAAIAQLDEGVILTDATGRITLVNDAAVRLHGVAALGVPPEEYSDTYHLLTVDGAPYPSEELPLARAVLRGETVINERWKIRRPDGSEILAVGTARPVLGANGRQLGAVLTLRDETAHEAALVAEREAEGRLAESERQFHTLADAIPTLAWTADADGYIDWYNRQWYEYTGSSPAEMEGWGWTALHDPAVLPEVLERWQASIRSGAPFEMTFPLRGADGRYCRFLTRVTPVRDADDRVIRWFGTNTDVEAERLARDAALSSALRTERLQALTAALGAARSLDEIAHVVVAEGRAATGAETGMLALRVPDTNEVTMIRTEGFPEDVAQLYERFPLTMIGPSAECIRTGVPLWVSSREALSERYPNLDAVWDQCGAQALSSIPLIVDGTVVGSMTYMYTTPQIQSEGDRSFFLAIGRQAAQAVERARLFAAEREARASAEAANKSKSDFLAAMSHEFRTPLNAIVGYAQLMEIGVHGDVTHAQLHALERIQRSSEHLLSLINDVLNFAKLEAGRVEYDISVLRLTDAVATVAPMVEPQLAAKGLVYEVDIAPELVVKADGEKLQQIILNLLSNAIKFTEKGGRITVNSAHRDGTGANFVFLRVTDSGIGIPRDRQEAVFDPFIQVHRNLTRTTEGTGLGLAISRDLARGMGGELRVRSKEGHGSTFTVALQRVL